MPEPSDSPAARLTWYRDHRQPPPPPAVRRRWNVRRLGLDALACLALSTLCFSQARTETLIRADYGFYNRLPLGAPTLLALLLNIVALAAVGFVGVQALRRVRRPAGHRLGAVAAVGALLIALNFARMTYEVFGPWTDVIGRPLLLSLVVVALAAAFGWPRPALKTIRRVALVASPLAVITLPLIPWMIVEVAIGPKWRQVDPEPLRQPPPSLRRVVWLVFDELDQRLTFEERPAGLELPELDRLRRESLYADAARPPAGATEISMPALITGRPVVAVTPTGPNDLELTFADGKPLRWTDATVFSRVRALGYDGAVIGWRLPYPRILGRSVGMADWRPSVAHEQARGDTFTRALRNQWGSLVPPLHVRRVLAQRVAELGDLAIRTAADGRFGLVLLHLPLPRTPGLYDRATGHLTTRNFSPADAAYVDNLAFADRLIADLRRGLERARLGDRTWLVVSSARWGMPRHAAGSVDHRVPFLVRPPDGGRGAHVDVAFNTLATHDLVLAILRGTIGDMDDAAGWLARRPAAPPKSYTSHGRPIY